VYFVSVGAGLNTVGPSSGSAAPATGGRVIAVDPVADNRGSNSGARPTGDTSNLPKVEPITETVSGVEPPA
jgi:hypothetical protein